MSQINSEFPQNTLGYQMGGTNSPARSDAYSLDILDLMKRKFWIILFFVLLGIASTLLYFFKAPKTYESTARIFVDEKSAGSMSGDADAFANDASIEKYMLDIKSTLILAPAIEAGKFHQLDSFAECNDILARLRESKCLVAKPADTKANSGVIKVLFRGADPVECQKVLEDIVASFDDHIKATTKLNGGDAAKILKELKEDTFAQLDLVDKEIKALMAQPGILITPDGRVSDPHQMQLTMMHQDLHERLRDRIKLEARVENINADRAAGKDLQSLVTEILRDQTEVSSAGAYAQTQTQLVQLKITEQDLLNQFGPDHPDVRKIRTTIRMVERMKEQESASLSSSNGASAGDIVEDYLNQMNQQIALIQSEERSLTKSIELVQNQSTTISATVENLNRLERKRERLETLFNTNNERLNEVDVFKEHLWRNLSVLDPPSVGEQVAPSLPISLAAGLFLGTLMGLFFAVFKDMAEKTFRSSDDVATILNSRVIGHVSMFQKSRMKRNSQFPNVVPELVTMHTPAAQASESYRAIRTAIFFKAQEASAKIIQVTSPQAGDGKSTSISNLAASIAQSGRRVLLIDADMRKPVQHKLFGATNDYGLSSVICGEMEPMEAVQVVQPEYFSVVTSGPIPSNPAELLTSARFPAILEAYRKEFDFVLIDSPPMMAVTDPSIICGHVDLIYMVMRIRNGVRTNSTRAKEMIDAMGVELGGIIINGLRRRDQKTYAYSGQYGYGTYSYGKPPTKNGEMPAPGSNRVAQGERAKRAG